MSRLLQIAHLALLLSAGALCVCACFLLLKVEATVQTFQQDGVKLAQTIDLVNRPCGGGKPCGTLAEIGKDAAKAGDAIVTTQIQERAIAPATVKAMNNLSTAANSLTGTANAATGTLSATTETFQTANTTIQGWQGFTPRINANLDAFHGLLMNANTQINENSPYVHNMLASVSDMTANANGVVLDFRKVSDKETEEFLKPVPWYMRPLHRFGETWDITAAVARHVP